MIVARVIVIGAGVAGLCAAIHASIAGHHVVVLDKAKRIGGRGTSQNKDGFSLHYGPHLIDRKGPLFKTARKLSRIRLSTKSIRMDKIEAAGLGLIRPVNNIRQAVENKRALRTMDSNNQYFLAAKFLATWGMAFNKSRWNSFRKNKLCVSNEGWVGLIGRLSAALDEIGVLIETKSEVTTIKDKQIILTDGRKVECDAIILACGVNTAKELLSDIDSQLTTQTFASLKRTTASIIEAGLASKPMGEKQAIVDTNQQMAMLDYIAIQPRLNSSGSHISAIAVGGLKSDPGATKYSSNQERLDKLSQFLDTHISGWKNHIVADLRQKSIIIGYDNPIDSMVFNEHGIILAGSWVTSKYILADAAAESGKSAGNNLKNLDSIRQLA